MTARRSARPQAGAGRPPDPAPLPALPPGVARLWAPTERARRGPAPSLDAERIVATAIALADAEGLPALSMSRLAERLGCAPMSLYRHVSSKDELLARMLDAAPGPPPAIDPAAGWREGLEGWARALHEVYLRHPWILLLTARRPPLEPGSLAWLECGLVAASELPLAAPERFDVLMAVLHFVRGQTQTVGAAGAVRRDDPSASPFHDYGRVLRALVDRARFPALRELLDRGGLDPASDGGDADPTDRRGFELGLARLLDGVAHPLARERSPGGASPAPPPRTGSGADP